MPLHAWQLTAFALVLLLSLAHTTCAQDDSPSIGDRVQRGKALYDAGQFEAAIEILKPAAKGNYSAIYRLSQAYQRLNKPELFIQFALPLAEQGDSDAQY